MEGVVAADTTETMTTVVNQEAITFGSHEIRVSMNITGSV